MDLPLSPSVITDHGNLLNSVAIACTHALTVEHASAACGVMACPVSEYMPVYTCTPLDSG
jgi:hypothetical protein